MMRIDRALAMFGLLAGLVSPARAQDVVPATADGVILTAGGAGNTQVARQFMSLTVFAGYGGVYRPGYWTPVDVVVDMKVPRDMSEVAGDVVRGTLDVSFPTGVLLREAHEFDLEVPIQGQHRVSLLVLPENDGMRIGFEPDRASRALGALTGSGVAPVFGTVRMRPAVPGTLLVATDGANDRPLRRALGRPGGPPVTLAALRPEGMPGRAAHWFGVDAAVFSLSSLGALPAVVQDGLLAWVQAGGHVVLTYDGAQARLPNAWQSALPAHLALGRQVIADTALEDFGGAPFPEGPRTFVAVEQIDPRGEVVFALGSLPLITRRTVASGTVTLVGANLGAPPFLDWAGLPALWAKLLPEAGQPASGSAGLRDALLRALLGFRDLSAVGLSGVLVAFALYAAGLGRGLSWLLRRSGRPEWYWAVAGGVVVVVLLVTVANPAVLSIDAPSVQTVSVARMRSGASVGRLETYVAGTAPVQSTMDLTLDGDVTGLRVFPASAVGADAGHQVQTVAGTPRVVAQGVAVGPTDAALVLETRVWTDPPGLRFVHTGGGEYAIQNHTGLMLTSAGIALPQGFLALDALPPGSETTVAPTRDMRLYEWAAYIEMKRLAHVFRHFADVFPQVRDLPGALWYTMIQEHGARWLGADPTQPTLMAWTASATVAAGQASGVPVFRGHTLLVVTPEDA